MRNKLKEIISKRGYSQKEVARRIGIGASTLSEYLKGSYTGNISELEKKITVFVEDFQDSNKIKEVDFLAQTENTGKIYGALHYLRRSVVASLDVGVTGSGKIAVISGKAGRGKTWTIKKYVAEHKGQCILIEAESNYSYSDIIKEIAKHFKIDTHHRVKMVKEDVIKALIGSGMIIIIDEAEHLKNDTIEQIRRIADKTGVGIALVGLESLLDKLRRLKGDFEYLFSRIVRVFWISDLNKDDVYKIVAEYLKEYNYTESEIQSLSLVFYEQVRGSARRLANLLPASINTMKLSNKTKLTKRMIEKTNELSMMSFNI